jgi:hypothetical protein
MSHFHSLMLKMFALCLIGFSANQPAYPRDSFNESIPEKIDEAAEILSRSLIAENAESVEIVQFSELSTGNIRVGVEQALRSGFVKRSIKIDEKASIQATGVIEIVDEENDLGGKQEAQFLQVKISIKLIKKSSKKEIRAYTLVLNQISNIAMAAGVVVRDLDNMGVSAAHAELRNQIKLVQPGLANPQLPAKPVGYFVDGTKIMTSPDSLIAVEIVTASATHRTGKMIDLTPRVPKPDCAFPFVPIGEGEMYGVKIYNNSQREIAVGLHIDGLSQFAFSEDRDPATGKPLFSHWIVAAKSSFTIPGWHLTSKPSKNNISRFLVTKYGEGASQVIPTKDPAKLGVITVSVSDCLLPGQQGKSTNLETGFGPSVELKQTVVERKLESQKEFISIRYQAN